MKQFFCAVNLSLERDGFPDWTIYGNYRLDDNGGGVWQGHPTTTSGNGSPCEVVMYEGNSLPFRPPLYCPCQCSYPTTRVD